MKTTPHKLIRTVRVDEKEQALYITEGFVAGEGDKYRIDKNGLKMWEADTPEKVSLKISLDELTEMFINYMIDNEDD
ncbi:MAG: hypothetical protein M0Q91_14390 [Methanoregula sp.]|jgi:hypothetical protein|nr:hypothetical protein [Methanoregula sp.]